MKKSQKNNKIVSEEEETEGEESIIPNNAALTEKVRELEKKIEILKSSRKEYEQNVKKNLERDFHRMFRIDNKDLNVDKGDKLGQGAFGVVFSGEMVRKRSVAVKYLTFGRHQKKSVILNEFNTQIRLVDPNVIRTFGYVEAEKGTVGFVMEKMEMNVRDYIAQNVLCLQEKLQIMEEMTKGLLALHEHRPVIIHRCIDPHNFLISKDGEVVKICDFATAALVEEGETEVLDSFQGIIKSSAPETLTGLHSGDRRGIFSIQSDVYSLGIAFWGILFGRYPMEDVDYDCAAYEIMKGRRPKLEVKGDGQELPKILKDLLEWCWKTERSERPTTLELLEWFDENYMDICEDYDDFYFPSREVQEKRKKEALEKEE